MAIDPDIADSLRRSLHERDGITEKKMFGGLCFMLRGNMLCGTLDDGAMYRVGKENDAAALAIPGAAPMTFTKRRMSGFIELRGPAFQDDAAREALHGLAVDFVGALPAK